MLNFIIEIFSWRTVFDILLITLGIFFVYRTLRRLGTWKILLGILMMIGIYIIALFLELDGISWFYNNVSQVAVIGFIVLFQPEIRKIFEAAVSTRRRSGVNQTDEFAVLIADTVEILAKQKRGALIVLPGKESISAHLSGGQNLDAEFSQHLILSIFDPHSPGHDGAMIIENGRVTRFGLRLPISCSDNLCKDYGTRHFAAAGLTEVTDSLVIAVSEERGTITLFQAGKATVQESVSQITNTINNHWQKTRTFLPVNAAGKRLIPWPEMAGSFLVACLLWYSIVIGEAEIHEKLVTVPVEYVGTPKDLVLAGNQPTELKAQLVGPISSFTNQAGFRVRVDLSKSMSGKQTVTITADHINLDKKTKLVDVKPSSLSIELVQLVEKELAIKPQLIGKVADSLTIVSVTANPDKLKAMVRAGVTREQELVLTTTPIYLEGIKDNTAIFSKVVIPPKFQPVNRKWPDIEIQIKVAPKKKPKTSG